MNLQVEPAVGLLPDDITFLVTSFFNATTAAAAALAAHAAYRSIKFERESRRRERRALYFKELVLDPLRRETDGLLEVCQGEFRACQEQLDVLGEGGSIAEGQAAIRGSIERFKDSLYPAKARIYTGIEAWGDEELLKAIQRGLEGIEDSATQGIEQLGHANPEPLESLTDRIQGGLSSVIAEVMQWDPMLQGESFARGGRMQLSRGGRD